MRKKLFRIVLHILTLACMVLIFSFSAQDAERSTGVSGGVAKGVARIFVRGFDEMPEHEQEQLIASWQHAVRKNAHFFVYMLLGVLTMATLLTYGFKLMFKVIVAFSIVVLYAVSDEIHQFFVPGRSCMFGDVLIDTAGSSLGMLVVVAVRCVIPTIRARRRR